MTKNKLQVLVLVEGGVVQAVYSNDANIDVTLVNMDNIEGGEIDKLDLGGFPVDYVNNARMQEIIDEYNDGVQDNIDNMDNDYDWD